MLSCEKSYILPLQLPSSRSSHPESLPWRPSLVASPIILLMFEHWHIIIQTLIFSVIVIIVPCIVFLSPLFSSIIVSLSLWFISVCSTYFPYNFFEVTFSFFFLQSAVIPCVMSQVFEEPSGGPQKDGRSRPSPSPSPSPPHENSVNWQWGESQ